ncbi:MgtC/SapB family protein [Lacibacterium aquatile]|uniref:MgtC/SapB family protein n=1 Tax=Lacibacterium aquatile TaxID=1168082 RepID=A0ABW5DPM7_9PROT
MPDGQLALRLAVALAIGLLIGLERGWKHRDGEEGSRTAGLRTFAITGLLGGVAGALEQIMGPMILAAVFLAYTAALLLYTRMKIAADDNENYGATSTIAALLTLALGAMAVVGEMQVAIGAGVAVAVLLALKQPLHSWLKRMNWEEFRAVLMLLAMGFLLLPLLPDRTIDPWDTINPRTVWIMAIAICGVSFLGYVAVKAAGAEAGLTLAAVTGGLASSTATTVTLARMARQTSGSEASAPMLLAGAILLAGAVMMGRVIVVASVLNAEMLLPLAGPLGAGAAASLILAGGMMLYHRHSAGSAPNLEIKNPFEFKMALKLCAIITVLLAAAKIAQRYLGESGLLGLALISGLADVDALTLSLARMAGNEVTPTMAAGGIGLAVASNSISKAVLTTAIGGKAVGLWVAAGTVVIIAAGAAGYWVLSMALAGD